MSVSIEDFGPALEAIAEKGTDAAWWASLDAGARAKYKQDVLDFLLPGIEVVLAEVNEQLDAEVKRVNERLDAIDRLFSGGPDTPCRTTWRMPGTAAFDLRIECVEVPMSDLRAALGEDGVES